MIIHDLMEYMSPARVGNPECLPVQVPVLAFSAQH